MFPYLSKLSRVISFDKLLVEIEKEKRIDKIMIRVYFFFFLCDINYSRGNYVKLFIFIFVLHSWQQVKRIQNDNYVRMHELKLSLDVYIIIEKKIISIYNELFVELL